MVGTGFTLSVGSETYGWDDLVTTTYSYDTTATASDITFSNLRDIVWTKWNETRTSNTITVNDSTYRDTVWGNWVYDNTTATPSITLGDVVWEQWIDENGRRVPVPRRVQQPLPVQYDPPKPPSPFYVLKQKLQKRRVVRTAKKKGRALLRSICSDEQWKDYLRYGAVREVGERAIYEVGVGWSGHIYEIGFDDNPLRKLCVHMADTDYAKRSAGHHWIAEDQVAAVLLALRFDEVATVAKACVHGFSEEQKRRVKARRGHKRRVA